MDYEKAYKNALERARNIHNEHHAQRADVMVKVFPELRESEDERIRKAIIYGMNNLKNQNIKTFATIPIDDCIVWLEKQGEKTEPIEGFNTEFERQISHLIASTINKEYDYTKDFVKWTSDALLNYAKHELEKQGEQKPVEQDTEVCDLWVYIREWNDNFGRLPKDEDELAACIDYVIKRQKPAEWSEEDEKKKELLISILEVNHPNGNFKVNPINTSNMEVMSTKELVNWLKSLKPNRWKPSEEQMKALNAINIFGELSYVGQGGTLVKLYNDLKKL